ncbi:MAG: hypothetical protein EHM78_01535 [Myxococcaceae bacterium]|nr:MAG: hypothetical protein EHM78_01535 [Myxococcaceae bacterium]
MASLNALRADAEAWLEEEGRARASAAPGPAQLAAVDAAHPEVVSPETARAVGALLASRRVPEHELPRLRILARFLEDASLEAVAREGRTALEASRWRSAPETGVEAPLAEAEVALAATEERPARLQREAAVNRAWEALLPRAQRLQADLADGASALGASSLPALLEARRDPAWPVLDLDRFLRTTEDAYRDVLSWALGRVAPRLLPLPRGDATLADLGRVRALPGYPGALDEAGEALRSWAARLPGADERERHLHLRTTPSPAARAIPVDIPEHIELLLPGLTEGTEAPRRFFWTGCALHLASVESEAPVEHRWMGDRAVVAASGWLVRGLLWRERWLRAALGLGRATAREVARMQALLALRALRAEAALQAPLRTMATAGPTLQRLGEASDTLSAVLQVRVGRGRTLARVADLDLSQQRLRAAALASCLWAEADRRFDADEFRNPLAARWLVAIWSQGAPEMPEQMATALCATRLGLERVGAELVGVLGA